MPIGDMKCMERFFFARHASFPDTPREAHFMSPWRGPDGGELFVRGSDFSTEFRCDQGELEKPSCVEVGSRWRFNPPIIVQDFKCNNLCIYIYVYIY